MKRGIIKGVALLMLTVLLVTSLSGCANKEVKSLIGRFESSCQNMDVDGILDCCNPAIVSPLRGLLGILGVKDLNGIIENLSSILGAIDFKDDSPEEVLKTLRIKPSKYVTNDAKDGCDVYATLSYTVDGKTTEKSVRITCAKGNDGWYIKGIR
ncbi:MAG: hypothetical protein II458_00425 [Oscillospiraceae bacterium]|nr:hypothetical protein [Oscillospiraceae bacterium]